MSILGVESRDVFEVNFGRLSSVAFEDSAFTRDFQGAMEVRLHGNYVENRLRDDRVGCCKV